VWQIVLFVAAGIAVAISGYFTFFRSGINLPHKLVLVDIVTGDLYGIDSDGKTILIPARSPVSGEKSLYPVAKGDDGEWVLDARSLEEIRAIAEQKELAIDEETGRVIGKSKDVRRISSGDLRPKG
jgi:hypothetical protein